MTSHQQGSTYWTWSWSRYCHGQAVLLKWTLCNQMYPSFIPGQTSICKTYEPLSSPNFEVKERHSVPQTCVLPGGDACMKEFFSLSFKWRTGCSNHPANPQPWDKLFHRSLIGVMGLKQGNPWGFRINFLMDDRFCRHSRGTNQICFPKVFFS